MNFMHSYGAKWTAYGIGAISVAALIAAAPLVATSYASGAPNSSPWPMALHDARHTATASAVGPQTGDIAWKRDLGGNITPGPVVGADGSIYVASSTGVLYALNPQSGANRWTFNAGAAYSGENDLSTSPLVLSTGSILWPGPKDTLYEISASGKLLWSKQFSGAVLSPVSTGQRVYVALASGHVWALSVGGTVPSLVWSVKVGDSSFGSPVIAPDGNVITTVGDSLVVVADHGSTGSVRWRRTLNAEVEVSASVGSDGSIYVTSNHSTAYDFSPAGKLQWSKKIGQESYSSSSVTPSGHLVFGDNGGVLHIVKASSGDSIVADQGMKALWGAEVIDARGDVYFGSLGKQVYGFDAKGHMLFDVAVSAGVDSYPAMTATGALVIGDEKGTLYDVHDASK
jgi:outer membrane protein assembly factor BamB